MTFRWSVATLGLALCGCIGGGGSGPMIQSSAEFQPGALFSDHATLGYGGTEVAVLMKRSEMAGGLIKFVLIAHGQEFETETYQNSDKVFAFVGIDDVFEPPIPLLKFPMKVGDKWEWQGNLTSATVPHKAEATVTTAREQLFLKKVGDVDSVRSDVRLLLDSGTPTPAERKLSFWFVRGKGVVKRELGTATTREPAPDPESK